ncbi:MAG: spondin domain-containing protein [Ignavibacterium sp.]|nr:MAG: spondin domain-containing protein [Ignavibacterium sp.]
MKTIFLSFSALILGLFTIGCNEGPTDIPTDPGTLEKSPSFTAEYEVRLENLSPAGSQPFSPPVFAVHAPTFRLFHIGGYASSELAQVAQDAFNDPLVTLLNNSPKVLNVVVGGLIVPGSSGTYNISAEGNYMKLSMVSMLVNTNDGFTGADKLQLPQKGTKTYYLRAYDAGSEQNTELEAHIPGPCCNTPFEGNSTSEKIRFHKGITGVGDLAPETYGWDEPVAKLTITRID